MRNRLIAAVALTAMCAAAVAGAACGSDDDDAAATSTPAVAASPGATVAPGLGATVTADGWTRVEGLRGDRYCEVLLPRVIDGRLIAEVWNSYGLNECPETEFKALDAAQIKEQTGAVVVLLNGPRYWLMDAIERRPGIERKEATFGTLEMFLAATVDLGPLPPDLSPYKERRVDRQAIFEFSKGANVFELLSNDGKTYVMQTYSVQNDPSLTEAALPSLGDRLELPAGWTYRSRTLDDVLRLKSKDDKGAVIQDSLGNSFTLVESE